MDQEFLRFCKQKSAGNPTKIQILKSKKSTQSDDV